MTGPRVNRLLASIPPGEAAPLLSELETVELRRRQVVWAAGDQLRHVYFPISSAIALVVGGRAGGALETGIVGSNAVVGLEAFFGLSTTHEQALVVVPGAAQRISAEAFARLCGSSTVLNELVRRQACVRFLTVGRSALCDATHSISHRCVRRLLTIHDCAEADDFPITQQSLSALLGVRRASVSVVAERLQRSGLIVYEHGRMHVADRAGLERECCACYGEMKEQAARLLPELVAGG